MSKVKNGFVKNLPYLCLVGVIALGLITIVGSNGGGGGGGAAAPGTCVNVAGTWNTTEVVNATDCDEGTYTEYNTYTVTQDGCNITVMPSTGKAHSGTVNGNLINYAGSWSEDGGTTTANISLTISGDSLSGSSSWTWTDGTDSCSGTTQITGTRTTTITTTTTTTATTTAATTTAATTTTAPGTGSLKITNNTSKSITEVYFSPTTSTTWGTNQLSTTISTGGTWTLYNIPPDDYDLQVVFSDGSTYQKWGISVVAGQTYLLTLTDTNIQGSLQIVNNTSKTITEVYFSPTTSEFWGDDKLYGTISPGGTWTLTDIPPDDYDLQVVFSDSTTYTKWNFAIIGGLTLTITLY